MATGRRQREAGPGIVSRLHQAPRARARLSPAISQAAYAGAPDVPGNAGGLHRRRRLHPDRLAAARRWRAQGRSLHGMVKIGRGRVRLASLVQGELGEEPGALGGFAGARLPGASGLYTATPSTRRPRSRCVARLGSGQPPVACLGQAPRAAGLHSESQRRHDVETVTRERRIGAISRAKPPAAATRSSAGTCAPAACASGRAE